MTRRVWITRCLRQIYGGPPSDDATITINLVNTWLETAIGMAAKANYKDAIAIDGIGYVNNSFYTKFKNIPIEVDDQFIWKITLPQVPLGIGNMDGISTVQIKDNSTPQISFPVVLISENQRSYYRSMRSIPDRIIGYSEGKYVYLESTLLLNRYLAYVTMVSGGDSTDLDSTLNVPPDYDPVMIEYIKQQLMFERGVPVDSTNDGLDAIKTT